MGRGSCAGNDLGTFGGLATQAYAVNARGQVVGSSAIAGGAIHAFSWTPPAGMADLGTLGGTVSAARAVNARGQVVGYSTSARGADLHAVLWSPRPTNKDQCKNNGWQTFTNPTFKNQGDCIQFVNTTK